MGQVQNGVLTSYLYLVKIVKKESISLAILMLKVGQE